jgi:5-methylcytosine-specific restriction enzyme A
MPSLPPRICRCGQRVAAGALCACQVARRSATEKRRPSARQRGYDRAWEGASTAWLALPGHELCACGCGRRADMIDHKVAPKGDMRLFWDRSNWQPMNRRCNSRKAASREGGFGNPSTFPASPARREGPFLA